jgi:integrase/recombinase XerD
MGRGAVGWQLKPDKRSGIYSVRFRHAGHRYDRSTGARDIAQARTEAARIYARIVSGQDEDRTARESLSLEQAIGAWLESIEPEVTPRTLRHYTWTALKFEEHFKSLDAMTSVAIADYARERLRSVMRSTVRAERVVMGRFLRWAVDHRVIASMPAFATIARTVGTRATKRKASAILLTSAEARAIIAALPERRRGHIVRARFAVQWETGLRPATVGRLRVPEHYERGRATLTITADIDKVRFARELPLTEAARAALDAACPDGGVIFGEHRSQTFLGVLRKAARASGLPEERAARFSAYDFRHGRVTSLLAGGAPLASVAYLVGHTNITTTNTYTHLAGLASQAAEALRLDESGGGRVGSASAKRRSPRKTKG